MPPQIRVMIRADTPAVSGIVADGYADLAQQEGIPAAQAELLQNTRGTASAIAGWLAQWRCFVAVADKDIVGALAIDRNDIGELWVDREHRRTGIGTALFAHAEQVIAAAGFPELTVRCAAARVRPFYEAMGCDVIAEEPCSHGPLTGWPLTYYRKRLRAR